jgi:hypothetical protein
MGVLPVLSWWQRIPLVCEFNETSTGYDVLSQYLHDVLGRQLSWAFSLK